MSIVRRSLQWLVVVVVACGLLLSPHLATRVHALGATWYVATTGNDSNSCSSTSAPCKTINGAIAKAAAADTVKVAVGTYTSSSGTSVVMIDRAITVSGGWDTSFSSQTGMSTIDGQNARQGISTGTSAINHLVVQNGYATFGAGIRTSGTVTLDSIIVAYNWATWMGGGIYVDGTLTISNTSIHHNRAGNDGSGAGGGGGIHVQSGPLIVNSSTLAANSIFGNYSGSAIDNWGPVTLNNTTVTGNIGAPALQPTSSAPLVLNNSTVTANTSGIWNEGGTITLSNTIVAGNSPPAPPYAYFSDCNGNLYSAGHNLIGNNLYCAFHRMASDKVGTPTAPINPRLGLLQNNGGLTMSHALMLGSPAIDAGSPEVPGSTAGACMPTDQRGLLRPAGARCDIGAYELYLPIVTSITRGSANPTSAATVRFVVTFSNAVTGVNLTAPFSDFALTTTGITGARITAVSGSARQYTVTVGTGTGNGAIRLDLIDDGTIADTFGRPLGGPGAGNGGFTTGPSYTISRTIPLPRSPSGTSWDTTPTFDWSKIGKATKYQLKLLRGTTLVYSGYLAGTACGATCKYTHATPLSGGQYKWVVRALINGAWKAWSPYMAFAVQAPKAGYWGGPSVDFFVTPDHMQVDDFSLYVSIYGCGTYKITYTPVVNIANGSFAITGSMYAKGKFATKSLITANASGTAGLINFLIPGCGAVSGSTSWTAKWLSPDQPVATEVINTAPQFFVLPIPDAPFGFFELKPAQK